MNEISDLKLIMFWCPSCDNGKSLKWVLTVSKIVADRITAVNIAIANIFNLVMMNGYKLNRIESEIPIFIHLSLNSMCRMFIFKFSSFIWCSNVLVCPFIFKIRRKIHENLYASRRSWFKLSTSIISLKWHACESSIRKIRKSYNIFSEKRKSFTWHRNDTHFVLLMARGLCTNTLKNGNPKTVMPIR